METDSFPDRLFKLSRRPNPTPHFSAALVYNAPPIFEMGGAGKWRWQRYTGVNARSARSQESIQMVNYIDG